MQVKTQDKQKHEQCVQVTGAQGLGIRETGSREVPAPPYLNGTMTQIGACSPPPFQSGVFATTEQTGRARETDHPSSREYNGPFKEPSLQSESGR